MSYFCMSARQSALSKEICSSLRLIFHCLQCNKNAEKRKQVCFSYFCLGGYIILATNVIQLCKCNGFVFQKELSQSIHNLKFFHRKFVDGASKGEKSSLQNTGVKQRSASEMLQSLTANMKSQSLNGLKDLNIWA